MLNAFSHFHCNFPQYTVNRDDFVRKVQVYQTNDGVALALIESFRDVLKKRNAFACLIQIEFCDFVIRV